MTKIPTLIALPFILIGLLCRPAAGADTQDVAQAEAKASAARIVTPPAKAAFHIYLLMGQSNMVGRDTRTLDAQTTNPRVLSLDDQGRWVVAKEPMHVGGTGIGPGIPFALEMLKDDATATIGLVPCAVGGTSLSRWVKGGDLYERAVARAKIAAAAGEIKGVLWHQGETDTAKQKNAEIHEARLAQMLKDLRLDLGLPELPIVVGQIGEFLTTEKYPYVDMVRTAIKHVAVNGTHVGFADSAGLLDKGDKLHFSAEAENELGARFASAMRLLQKPAATKNVSTELSGKSLTPLVPLIFATATVDVWPKDAMPGRGATEPEITMPAKPDGFHRVTNISNPTLTFFRATRSDNKPAPAIIVCPGGGYSYVVVDMEGSEIAAWLNSVGISALVLKYRAPQNREGALQDIQRALRLTRDHAAEWNIDPHQLGVMGFSAGGNLSAKASTGFDNPSYPAADSIDQQSCRPDFAVLVYPAYMGKDGKISADLNLTAKIPPTLIVQAEDDSNFVAGTKLYDAALIEAKIPHKFILYPTGGHGYGLRSTKDARAWPQAAIDWFHQIGVH